ncbi:MAG: DUF4278 domain-containing protein [Phormidesmis sp.]
MKLNYHGAAYVRSPQSLETISTDTKLFFLGKSFNLRVAKSAPAKASDETLKYRGVSYQS